MQILLSLAPFLLFATVDRLAGALIGLIVAALAALLLLGWESLIQKRSSKILDIGTSVLFCGLSLYFLIAKPAWSVIAVRFA